jgi:hypothetical protein
LKSPLNLCPQTFRVLFLWAFPIEMSIISMGFAHRNNMGA